MFVDRLCDAVMSATADDSMRSSLLRSACDTIAVAAGGFVTPAATAMARAYRGVTAQLWSGGQCDGAEAAVLINATAAHALDFDDVLLDSHVHASTVLLPVILSLARSEDDALAAFAAGLIGARAVAAALGAEHYHRGWHGTGTIGAFAAAAAASRALHLNGAQTRSAFALVAAMAGGLQANFGSMAKPSQAGFAAVAGVRAARLAGAGVEGASDIFGGNGFLRLYGAGPVELSPDAFMAHPEGISLKLYPSCFAAARLVGVALDARAALGPIFDDPAIRLHLNVPAGSLAVLRYDRPATGAEAKFSAHYNVAVALISGTPTLAHFEDAAVSDARVAACLAGLTITEDLSQRSGGDIRTGIVALEVRRDTLLARYERSAIPGSPEDPPQPDQLAAKWAACLDHFARIAGQAFPVEQALNAMPSARRILERTVSQ